MQPPASRASGHGSAAGALGAPGGAATAGGTAREILETGLF